MTLLPANADLTECDREPITRLERIQSFGFLLAMTHDWTIVRASANLERFIGIKAEAAIGHSADLLLNPKALHDIRNRMLALFLTRGTERLFGISLRDGHPPFDIAVHQSAPFYILEAEPSGSTEQSDAVSMVRGSILRLQGQASMENFHRDAARQVRAMMGFDRVMIYRFNEEGAGEVIAESVSTSAESYYGLHYPASDIPQQARALYVRNPFRIIVDVHSEAVPIISISAGANEPLDLTLSVTRAVSPIHIEYLRNMEVAASLSISIVVEGALWGLIACHHTTSRRPSFMLRTAAEFFGQMYSMTLESRLRKGVDESDSRVREATNRLVQAVVGDDALVTRAEWLQDVMQDIIECDGTVVALRGTTFASGLVPNAVHLAAILQTLNSMPPNKVLSAARLAEFVPGIDDYPDRPAGFLALPLSSTPRDYLLLFRREQIHDVHWAGNPEKPVAGSAGTRISPRKSFEAFQQTIRGKSVAFSAREISAAEAVRSALIEVSLRVAESSGDARQRVTERQETLIAELNHRLRNIFGLVRGLINQSHHDAQDIEQYVTALDGRILALARAHERVTRKHFQPVPLNGIFEEEINTYVPRQRDRVAVRGSSVLLRPTAFSSLALVVHELFTNSSKYGALSADGRVDVEIDHEDQAELVVRWRESGGPLVRPPTRRGFGSVVLERIIPYDLKGTVELKYESTGFEASFHIPGEHVLAADKSAQADAESRAEPAGEAASHPLMGLSVLLLEDNLIAALEAEDMLKDFGAKHVWTIDNIAAAKQVMAEHLPDFAMLDVNVGAEKSFALAAEIHGRGIPFLYASGYGDHLPKIRGLDKIGCIAKPYERTQLCTEIAQLLLQHPKALLLNA